MSLATVNRRTLAVLVVSLAFFQLFTFSPFVELLYRPLVAAEQPVRGDAIIILSSDFFDSGLPGLRTFARLTKGLDLYRKGYAPVIICSGGVRIPSSGASYARAMKETLVSWGVDKGAVLVQDETVNTYNDIRYLADHAGNYHIDLNKSMFVTSSYHTLRVRKILDKRGVRAPVVSAEPVELQPKRWSLRPDFLREAIREYGALAYFTVKGWI